MDFRAAVSLISEGNDALDVARAIADLNSKQLSEDGPIDSVKRTLKRSAITTRWTAKVLKRHVSDTVANIKHHLKTHYTSRGRNTDGRHEVSIVQPVHSDVSRLYGADTAELEKHNIASIQRGGHASNDGHHYGAFMFHKRSHAEAFKKFAQSKGALTHPTIHDHDGNFGRDQRPEVQHAKKIVAKNKGNHISAWSHEDKELFKHHAHGLSGENEEELRNHMIKNGHPEYKTQIKHHVFMKNGKINAAEYEHTKELWENKRHIEKAANSLNAVGLSHHKKATGHRHSVAAFKKGTGEAVKFREQMQKDGFTTSLGKEHDGDDVVVVNHKAAK